MRKHYILFVGLLVASISFAQTSNSVLATGTWYKFAVDTTGVFKIDRGFLQQLGVPLNGLNPKKIHIYGNGGQQLPVLNSDFRYDDLQENALFIAGESDNSFDASDYILFYAKGPHDWQLDPANALAIHRHNPYTDLAYYFITINDTDGKRIQQKTPISGATTSPITLFDEFTYVEKDERNLFAAGMQWFFASDFNIRNTQTFNIPFPNAAPNEPLTVKVRAVSNSVVSSIMEVTLNNQQLFTINLPGVNPQSLTKAIAIERAQTSANTPQNIAISIAYNNNGNPSANAFLDYIEIIGKKQLTVGNFQFGFRSFQQANASGTVQYQLANGASAFQIWDVSNPITPQQITNETSGSDFVFRDAAGALKEYVVLNERDFYTPIRLQNSRVQNQNLHGLRDINYLIITNATLAGQAQRLAAYHEENSNLSTKVVLIDEIYNEFASGAKDITGIRDFIKLLYDTNSAPDKKLQYVCFFGDASYDYKDRISMNNNIIPVKLAFDSFNLANSYVTDDFYVMLDANEGTMTSSHTIDVASSRIPVSTLDEATRSRRYFVLL